MGKCGEVWGSVGKCGEVWGSVGKCGEVWGSVGKCGVYLFSNSGLIALNTKSFFIVNS